MAVPKQKISKRRQGNRRAHDALTAPHVQVCSRCKATVKPHFACMDCGYYNKKKVTGNKPAMAVKPVKAVAAEGTAKK